MSAPPFWLAFRRLRRELVWVIAGQFLAFAGGLAAIKILTNIMGPAHYGELAIGLTVSGLVSLFIFGPLGQGMLRFFSICRENGTLPAYFAAMRRLHVRVSVILAVLTLPALLVTGIVAGERWAVLVFLALLFGWLGGINHSMLSLQNALRRRRLVALHQGMDTWLRLGMASLLLLAVSRAGSYALGGYCLGMGMILLSQYAFASRDARVVDPWCRARDAEAFDAQIYAAILRYIKPFLVFAILGVFVLYADRWILLGYYGEKEVGIYAALYMIASAPITLLVNLAGQFILPLVFDQSGGMQRQEQAHASSRSIMLSVLVVGIIMAGLVIGAFLFGGHVIRWMSNAEFGRYASSFWLIVLGLCLFHLGQLLIMRGLSFGRSDIYILPKAIQAGSFFLLALWLARQMDIAGVALALCISSLLYLVAVVMVNRRLASSEIR